MFTRTPEIECSNNSKIIASVTADGVKTFRELLNELYPFTTNLKHSMLVRENVNGSLLFSYERYRDNSCVGYTNTDVESTSLSISTSYLYESLSQAYTVNINDVSTVFQNNALSVALTGMKLYLVDIPFLMN